MLIKELVILKIPKIKVKKKNATKKKETREKKPKKKGRVKNTVLIAKVGEKKNADKNRHRYNRSK